MSDILYRNKYVLNEAIQCINNSGSEYGKLSLNLINRTDRIIEFYRLKKYCNFLISKKNKINCYLGYCGPWLEDLFETYVINSSIDNFGPFIPLAVPWVNLWRFYKYSIYLKFLNSLFSILKDNCMYITVSQNANGIEGSDSFFKMPKNLLIISQGGRGHIPSLLFLKEMKPIFIDSCNQNIKFCFLGSLNNGPIRNKISMILKNTKFNYYIGKSKDWKNIYSNCRIILTPRGFGRTSFRLTEVLQLGFIPYYIYDEIWLPYLNSKLNWTNLIFLSNVKNFKNDLKKINSISCKKLNMMKKKIILHYRTHFDINSIFLHIKLFMKYGFNQSDLRCSHFYNYH